MTKKTRWHLFISLSKVKFCLLNNQFTLNVELLRSKCNGNIFCRLPILKLNPYTNLIMFEKNNKLEKRCIVFLTILPRLLFTTNFFFLVALMFKNWSFMKVAKRFLVEIYIIVPSKKHKISLDVIFSIKNNIIILFYHNKESLNISLKE